VNVIANFVFKAHAGWALFPIAIFAFGWALMVPVVTLLVLDLYPERRGLASSLQAVIASTANGVVAGAVTPLVMHSTRALALTSIAFLAIGLVSWGLVQAAWPQTGHAASHPPPGA
jgi:DHA1 family bicyclomycin/chloramphenicol resistance-like MFS transporter